MILFYIGSIGERNESMLEGEVAVLFYVFMYCLLLAANRFKLVFLTM